MDLIASRRTGGHGGAGGRREVPTAVAVLIGTTAVMVLAGAVVRIAVHRDRPRHAVAVVLASADGVTLVRPAADPIRVSTAPATVAYGVGADHVAFQEDGEGPIKAWSRGAVRDLPLGRGQPYARLLDAGAVSGVPYALVSEHSRGTAPSASYEEVVRIGLRDGSRTLLLRRPAWETGYREARLLPGGDVLGLLFSLIYYSLVRVSPPGPAVRWDTHLGADAEFHLLLRDGVPSSVSFRFDRDRGRAPELTVIRHDVESGQPGAPATVEIAGLTPGPGAALSCRDWLSSTQLACGREGGPPLAISVVDGSSRVLPGGTGAMPTVVRPA